MSAQYALLTVLGIGAVCGFGLFLLLWLVVLFRKAAG